MSENSKETAVKQTALQNIFEWVETFCLALLGVVAVFTFICRFVTVQGPSMMNTLQDKDRLIISSLFYTPKGGDIVVVQDSQEEEFRGPIIKRVIATAGETVDIDNKTWEITVTHLDGSVEVLDEVYANKVYTDTDGDGKEDSLVPMTMEEYISDYFYPDALKGDDYPHVVKEGCVFVLGDNRTNSLDSRYVGDIDSRKILGKAYVRIFPFNTFKFFF
jgi:signal peptidase I